MTENLLTSSGVFLSRGQTLTSDTDGSEHLYIADEQRKSSTCYAVTKYKWSDVADKSPRHRMDNHFKGVLRAAVLQNTGVDSNEDSWGSFIRGDESFLREKSSQYR